MPCAHLASADPNEKCMKRSPHQLHCGPIPKRVGWARVRCAGGRRSWGNVTTRLLSRPSDHVATSPVVKATPQISGFSESAQGEFQLLCLAKTPSTLEPLTISPRAWILPGSMRRLLVALLLTLLSAMRSRRHLVIENLALRQQLATLAGRRHLGLIRSGGQFDYAACLGLTSPQASCHRPPVHARTASRTPPATPPRPLRA